MWAMGRIKQTYLKRVAEDLLENYPEDFNADFQNNKEKVGEYTDVSSKKTRNKIAGCLVRMVKKNKSS